VKHQVSIGQYYFGRLCDHAVTLKTLRDTIRRLRGFWHDHRLTLQYISLQSVKIIVYHILRVFGKGTTVVRFGVTTDCQQRCR
jgi:hypothetical protein